MPYVTEELWQRLPSSKDRTTIESIMICKYPSIVEGWTNETVEYEMDLVDSAVKSLRSLANERCERNEAFAEIIDSHQREIITFANLSTLTVIGENDDTPVGCAVCVVNENLSVYLELQGTLSPEAELEKIRKKVDEIQKQHDNLSKVTSATCSCRRFCLLKKPANILKLKPTTITINCIICWHFWSLQPQSAPPLFGQNKGIQLI